jgi:hypothetical protein
MELELNIVLNWTNFKFFMKMTRNRSFRNPKNQYQRSNQRLHKQHTHTQNKTEIEGSFLNQEPSNTNIGQFSFFCENCWFWFSRPF